MWKEAINLALFEWKIDWFNRILHQILLLAALLVFSYATYESIIDDGGWGLDVIYFAFFVWGFGWLTPKDFQYQKVSSHTYASPVFFMLHKLPIQNSTLIKSRFIIFYINALPILVYFL
ncbi:hypothetical protein [Piscibacillus salipiscarius]|uniref:hypothetical protein n=1 Tax=Piscibacillus salipiscarius TaxID=299480 RepID=UPI0006CFBC4D|nr:hypothetical protein [Piscibacillus salipiscarius]